MNTDKLEPHGTRSAHRNDETTVLGVGDSVSQSAACKALLDRVTGGAHIIETGTTSFRFRLLPLNGDAPRESLRKEAKPTVARGTVSSL